VIEIPVFKEEKTAYKSPTEGRPDSNPESNTKPQTTKLSALDKIRKQVKGNGSNGNGNSVTNHPLEFESLQSAWNEYVQRLKSEKNPAGTNFEMAELKIQDANSFIAIVTNNIQLRFIEQGGQKASQFLREKLHNSLLEFFIVMEENKEEKILVGAPLTSREQFLKMTEKYPLVKELKDRLRLELDY
jgi:DNA polymerase-3 subunit gamma/tau